MVLARRFRLLCRLRLSLLNTLSCVWFIVPYKGDTDGKLRLVKFALQTELNRFEVGVIKLLRACGGCLGVKRR